MTHSYVSRADLVRALMFHQSEVTAAVADVLGLEYLEPTTGERTAVVAPGRLGISSPEQPTRFTPNPVLLWRATRLTVRGDLDLIPVDPDEEDIDPDALAWTDRPNAEVGWEPLAQKREVLTKLRTKTGTRRSRGEIDIEQVVDRLSRGEFLHRFPHHLRRTWGSGLFFVQDRARYLVPYWKDQDHLAQLLQEYYPHYALTVARRWSGCRELEVMLPEPRSGQTARPTSTDVVLVVGDLGMLSHESADREFWIEFGRDLNDVGLLALALTPCQPDQFDAGLRQLYRIIPWEASVATFSEREDSEATLEELLTLVSPATRLEPGLLRAIRRLFPQMRGHADLEGRLWNSDLISSQHSVAASFDETRANQLRECFRQLPHEKKLAVARLIRDWRGGLQEDVWFEELIGLDAGLQWQFGQDAVDARRNFRRRLAEIDERRQKGETSWLAFQSWGRGLWRRLPADVKSHRMSGQTFHQLWEAVRSSTSEDVAGFDPAMVGADSRFDRPVAVDLWQQGGHVTAQATGRPEQGSWLGRISTLNRRLVLSPLEQNRPRMLPDPPSWANGFGRDRFGVFADLEYAGVTQRLRWIPAGTFRMGSPEGEAGRFENEGPCHEVTLTCEFWLFDTPCTQALWEAVMGQNPSQFVSENRPVDSVSWEDIQEFLQRLNGAIPDLELRLPTEAEWEYACRAGTTEATYAGPVEILGDANAPALDPIAWYGGNCGVDFDLRDGFVVSWLKEKQYDYKQGGTRTVALKRLNPWGLYDMLGNVWEWCHDGRREYSDQAATDPIGVTETRADRVLRGGSWISLARSVRAAYRFWSSPDDRDGGIGFRCARVQAEGAESLRSESERSAEHSGDRAAAYGAVDFNLTAADVISRAVPRAERLIVISDLEEIELERHPRPAWTKDFGRDEVGLFADLEFRGVTQRLRWIPPGRFRMGSPEDEAGRFENEGPCHEVTLSSGFWLFDTPCTQALWEAVMGKNPSRFESADRPVENVSWEEVQGFLAKLNGEISGLDLRLPTEAEWEYSCRAGTLGATWLGNLDIFGVNNAPVLDEIAWYGGNSGVDFDLPTGHDSSGWNEKQSDHSRAGTRRVKQKSANPWGLYDMLGNVWEWCHDGLREYSDQSATDPVGPTDVRADRVLRGGGWIFDARIVRAASRDWLSPDYRNGFIGFRCARVQAGEG